jgi:hypothetical protein
MNIKTQNITLSAMFIALGILIPVLFHIIGIGPVFLPMFWPIAVSAFFVPVSYAIAVGMLTPILSTIVTGMPPISPPILHVMIFELCFLSGIIGFMYNKTLFGSFWLTLTGLIVSRIVLYICAAILSPILGLPTELVSMAMILRGIPGTISMLLFIPILIRRVKNEPILKHRQSNV